MRPSEELALLGVVALAGFGLGAWLLFRNKRDPRERERLRRVLVATKGRMGDGMVTDVGDNTLFYTYSIRGVEYTASQDVSSLRDHLPADLETLIGPVTLKFMPRNPFNSILLSEDWSGFRNQQSSTLKRGA